VLATTAGGLALVLAMAAWAACSSASGERSHDTTTSAAKQTTTTTAPPPTFKTRFPQQPPIPARGAYFGTWRGPGPLRPDDPQQRLVQAEQQIGRKYAIDHRYYDWGSMVPSPYEYWTSQQGRIPMVNVCACRFADGSTVPWAQIASGSEDAYIVSIAGAFKLFNKPAFFVFDAEPETKLKEDPSLRAADYVAAWKRIVAIFRAQQTHNVAFVWATTAYAFKDESGQVGDVKSLYPGDDVVDWIASDPYNFNHSGAWHSLRFEMETWYKWARAEHPDKPLALAEWGSKEDPKRPDRKADWYREALGDLRTNFPAVKAVVYFDEEKHEDGGVNDWRIDTSTTTEQGFAQIASSDWFDFSVRSTG
jgi:hypothetical protein